MSAMNDVPTRLMDAILAGLPWPVSLEKQLARVRPGHLLRILRQLKVRDQLFRPDGQDLPQLAHLIGYRPRRRPDADSVSLPRLLYLLRAQWDFLTSAYSDATRDRLDHVWQVQLCPGTLKEKMSRFLGLTFLPGRRQQEFADGEVFVDLRNLNVLSLGVRLHEGDGRQLVDMFDVKVHAFEVNAESGQAFLTPRYARYFNYCPFPDAHRRIVEADNVPVVRGALDLHRAMEWACVTGAGLRVEPRFPRLYLALPSPDLLEMEVTTDLKVEAFHRLDAFVRAGSPRDWSACPNLGQLAGVLDRRPRPTWAHYEKGLRESDARFVLMSAYAAATVEHRGLHLVPLEFFSAYSPQRPVTRAAGVFARMDGGVLGRTALRGRPVLDGEKFVGVEGHQEECPRLASVQVLRVPGRDDWAGTTGPVEWNFRTVPDWCEPYFREAVVPGGDGA